MKLGACLQDVAAAGGNQQLLQPSRCLGRTKTQGNENKVVKVLLR